MRSRGLGWRVDRLLAGLSLLVLPIILSGCMFYIDQLVPDHGNVGDRVVLRISWAETQVLYPFQVLFERAMAESILLESPQEILVEIPPDLEGDVHVSVWLGSLPVSNIKPFTVDMEPIVYRVLGFGDSLMGPWTFHTHMLDTLLNENIGPSLVINEGKAGETLSEGAQRLARVLSTHAGVEYIYILEGANDVSDGKNTPIGEMLAALDQMMDQVSVHSLYPILLTIPPRTRQALLCDQTWPTTEDWNDALRNYAIVHGIQWVDLYQAFMGEPAWESFLLEDGLHLTTEGQEFVADIMYSVVAPLLD